MRTTSATKAVAKAGPPPAGPAKRRFAGLVPWLSRLAVAASFLVAFGLGLRIQGYLERNDTPTTSVASDTLPPTTPAAMQDERWDTVRLVVDEQEGAPGQIEVPVVEGPDALQWVTSRPPAMPPHVAGELRSQGYDVLTERHLIYVDLEDGRRVVFPVDEIKVQLVRRAQ
ncbi:MAG: hypothetical protein HYS13_00105 [Planctomycetia bacterium]|nr:hypothetical protein [Planctomycetia bacterium]